MSYDWKALAPTRPLAVADVGAGGLYVERVGSGAREIDALLESGLEQPIALFGPAGAGKSTELAALAKRREASWVGPLVRLDKLLVYGDSTSVGDVLVAIAKFITGLAIDKLGMNLATGPLDIDVLLAGGSEPFDVLLSTIREIRSASRQGVVGLLVDGLEKASSGLSRRVLAQLERLASEARVVVVVPMELATGPSAAALHDYHLISIGPVIVEEELEPSFREGRDFLFRVVARRLGVGGPFDIADGVEAVRRCVTLSGGLIRTFLQLLQKAALYGAMRGQSTPDEENVTRAAQEQTSFLLRLLKEGDVEALLAAHGTNGMETPIDRRIRFLANGLLLEYRTGRGQIARIAPLLANAILKVADGD